MATYPEETSESFLHQLVSRAQRHRRVVAALVYTGITTGALGLAYLVRSDFNRESVLNSSFAQTLLVLPLIRLGVNYLFRLGLGRWRYVGIRDFGRLLVATTAGSVSFLVLMNWSFGVLGSVPVSIVLLEWVFPGRIPCGHQVAQGESTETEAPELEEPPSAQGLASIIDVQHWQKNSLSKFNGGGD